MDIRGWILPSTRISGQRKSESGASGTANKNGVKRSGERRLFAAQED